MEPSKSQVEIYLDLSEHLLRRDPLGIASKSLQKDIETLKSRTLSEGLSFLTKTLPKLGKALDLGLASMQFSLPLEFKRSHGSRNIPAFMQGYFNCIFDADGILLEKVDPAVVKHCRQVLFALYKLEIPFSDKQNRLVLDNFVETDLNLKLSLDRDSQEILEVSSHITKSVFFGFNPKEITPRHGPGAVATGERLEEKWKFSRLYDGIHQQFPYYDYFIVGGGSELIDRLEWYKSLERLDRGRAKVVLVPKDSRGPRLISCEPLEYQWIQQGLGRKLVSHLERNSWTMGHVNFTDQSINRSIALRSSTLSQRDFISSSDMDLDDHLTLPTDAYATIDLKDASDRVSVELVERVFSKNKSLLKALLAARTTSTLLPDGRIVEFQKFAPMGSALCFPVEAYIFWVLLVAAISRHLRLRQRDVAKLIYVYGDDIIVPTNWYELSVQSLERFALLVNRSKCCVRGPFRESCGMDAFAGTQVTPIRLKTPWSGRKTDGAAYMSWLSFANQIANDYPECSNYVRQRVEELYGKVPYGTLRSPYPCIVVSDPELAEEYNSRVFRRRYRRNYQRFEFFLPIAIPRRIRSTLEGWPRMLRDLVSPPYEDPSEVVLPRSTVIKRGWTPVG